MHSLLKQQVTMAEERAAPTLETYEEFKHIIIKKGNTAEIQAGRKLPIVLMCK